MNNIYVILLLVLTVACNKTSNSNEFASQIKKSKSDAITIHDELMTEMGNLNSLKKKLEIIAQDSLSEEINDVKISITAIEKADKSMWDWMHNFDVTYAHDDDSITLEYYRSQLDDIKKVRQLFNEAFSQGEKATN